MWFSKTQEQVLAELMVEQHIGLSNEEAQKRLEQYGENKLKGKPKKKLISLFLEQLKDMLIDRKSVV